MFDTFVVQLVNGTVSGHTDHIIPHPELSLTTYVNLLQLTVTHLVICLPIRFDQIVKFVDVVASVSYLLSRSFLPLAFTTIQGPFGRFSGLQSSCGTIYIILFRIHFGAH